MVELFQPNSSPLIYVYRINDADHKGAVKVGGATYKGDLWPNQLTHDCKELRKAAHNRIKGQTLTAGIPYELVYATPAFSLEKKIHFNDKEIHAVLVNSGFKKRVFNVNGTPQEWIECDPPTVMKAIEAIKEGRKLLNPDEIAPQQQPIDFREEQKAAIKMAVDIFKRGGKQALWNAKMRFGKTVSALGVVKQMQYKRTLILTHRPVVNEGWFEDFNHIFFDTGGRWIYGSKSAGITFDYVENFAKQAQPNSYVYFVSMQDLRGSSKAGGKFDKNNALFACDWDLIIVDEAHEGTQTELGKNVLEELKKQKTKVLHLSGTPFNIQNDFSEEETFTWDYVMEQKAKMQWEIDHPGDYNPYGNLPTMNIYTYDLGRLLEQKQFADKEVAFNFREFFRTNEDGIFVHEEYVNKFLDLLSSDDKESLYPFSNKRFRNIFRHTLWMVPGVKEAAALEQLLLNHPNFGARGVKIVNVAGDMDVQEEDEARRYNNALTKLNEAITDNPFATETITLSCGRLTTGVSVKPWSGVLMLSGTYNTAASTYMQTIFRVQTPFEYGGLVKDNCYVFDFAPDRTLTVLSEVARINTKPGKADTEQKQRLGEFLNYCSVIAEPGSQMKRIDANRLMERVKKVYIERVVRSGFEDDGLYNDELLKLTSVDVDEFNKIGKAIGRTKAQKGTTEIDVNKQGLTDEQYKKAEEAKKKPKKERTAEEEAAIAEANKRREMRQNAISVLRSISIRMPLLIYGANIDDDKEEITIDNFEKIVDDASWNEFMPMCEYEETGADGKKRKFKRPLSRQEFRRFKKYYDEDIFIASAKRIRQMVRNADEMMPEQRITRIAEIFATFRNPDKETVLTPWRVVNMHLSDCIGGYTFFKEDFKETLDEPRFVDRGKVTFDIFNPDSRLLEINSKTGLYPLFLTYNIYRAKLRNLLISPQSIEEHLKVWDEAVAENIFVICKTKMAKYITTRTLLGFRPGQTNMWAPDDLFNKVKNQPDLFIDKVKKIVGKNVKIKAIVGNPPYQDMDGGGNGAAAMPIYNRFVDIARKISPSYISMITPARWYGGGRGLDEFRESMLKETHIEKIVDFPNEKICFPSANISGGVSYWLWNASHDSNSCLFVNDINGKRISAERQLNEYSMFIRYNNAISIIHKILNETSEMLSLLVAQYMPFGIRSYTRGTENPTEQTDLKLLSSKGYGYVSTDTVTASKDYVDKYNVIIGKAISGHLGETDADGRVKLLALTDIIAPNEVCTESYLAIGKFDERKDAESLLKYINSKFLRFLLLMGLTSMNITKDRFLFVPIQDFTSSSDIDWSKSVAEIDQQLYAKYDLSTDEIAFIESMIKSM